jgi:endonuclease YncB( thermonuclease family)
MVQIFTFLSLFLLFPGILLADFEGKVFSVVDGDTIHVSRFGQQVKVNIKAIKAPGWNSKYFRDAKKELEDIVKGERVTVKTKDHGLIGGVYGDVVLKSGVNVAHAMVKKGYARWDRNADPGNSTLARFEQEARDQNAGLWRDRDAKPIAEDGSGFARNESKSTGVRQEIKKDKNGRCITPGSPDYEDLEDYTGYASMRECREGGGTFSLQDLPIPIGRIEFAK